MFGIPYRISAIPSTAVRSTPLRRPPNDGHTIRAFHTVGLPSASRTEANFVYEAGRYVSCCRSSSRDHWSWTGTPAAFETSTASAMKSARPRRPKPPPRYIVWIWTFSAGNPVICTAASRAADWICVPVQTSQPSARTCATALSGSIGACARYGASYIASIFRGAPFRAAAASPSLRATAPGFSARSANVFRIVALDVFASAPSSHCSAVYTTEGSGHKEAQESLAADLAEERPHVINEQLGLLQAGEVTTPGHLRIVHEVEVALQDAPRRIQRRHLSWK